eukprot:1763938-Pleurochrysis_carterae.AAC.1
MPSTCSPTCPPPPRPGPARWPAAGPALCVKLRPVRAPAPRLPSTPRYPTGAGGPGCLETP